jgi:hypothetical protein
MVFFVDEKSQIQALDRTQTPLPFDRGIATLTLKCIRRSTHRSTRQLEQAIRHYIKVNNVDPNHSSGQRLPMTSSGCVKRF